MTATLNRKRIVAADEQRPGADATRLAKSQIPDPNFSPRPDSHQHQPCERYRVISRLLSCVFCELNAPMRGSTEMAIPALFLLAS